MNATRRPALLLLPLLTLTTTMARADPPPPPPTASPRPAPAIARTWPVGTRPSVVRGWDPPATVYARGHRGVDLAAAPGTPVRAVAAGRVSYAGRVAGRGVVSVDLAGTGLRTTYEPVRASVPKGEEVAAGEVIGEVESTGSHYTAPCLHWGLRRGGTYLNPLTLLPPWLLHRGPSRLLPVPRPARALSPEPRAAPSRPRPR
ncbi:murein hydrolase activator EnvC family protein [Streptomyces sp. NPDC000345]|uniref:murein hydrolase activator EnvC family protein n=1 Tax=Streptomyces sp. NPDC000345 TaxID=3364537 RepID=UPI003685A5C9